MKMKENKQPQNNQNFILPSNLYLLKLYSS